MRESSKTCLKDILKHGTIRCEIKPEARERGCLQKQMDDLLPDSPVSSPKPPFVIPILLGALALSLFFVLLWRFNTIPAIQPPPAPTRCSHWIALRGSLEYPKVVCWRTPPSPSIATRLHRWRLKVQQTKPKCRLPANLPLPPHGHQLVLSLPQKGNRFCHHRIRMMRGSTRLGLGLPLQVNRDTARDLAAIPGLSLHLAKRIILYRKQHGPFQTLHDLVKVKGIGHKTMEKIKPHLTWKKKPQTQRPTP